MCFYLFKFDKSISIQIDRLIFEIQCANFLTILHNRNFLSLHDLSHIIEGLWKDLRLKKSYLLVVSHIENFHNWFAIIRIVWNPKELNGEKFAALRREIILLGSSLQNFLNKLDVSSLAGVGDSHHSGLNKPTFFLCSSRWPGRDCWKPCRRACKQK